MFLGIFVLKVVEGMLLLGSPTWLNAGLTGIDAGFWRLPETGLFPLRVSRYVNGVRLLLLINCPEKVFLPFIDPLSHLLLLSSLVRIHDPVLDRPPTFIDLIRIFIARPWWHGPNWLSSLAVLYHEGGRLWLRVDKRAADRDTSTWSAAVLTARLRIGAGHVFQAVRTEAWRLSLATHSLLSSAWHPCVD